MLPLAFLIDAYPRVTAATAVLTIGLTAAGVGYLVTTTPTIPEPQFAVGDYVKLSVSGERGRVYDNWCYRTGCRYDVRFSAGRRIDNVREHELELAH